MAFGTLAMGDKLSV